MKRQALEGGRWFDRDGARIFEEDTFWDGHNHISKATGSQWNHEALYRTVGGRWILHTWSQWQGSRESWSEIDDTDAARWLVTNGHDAPGIEGTDVAYAELEVR